jgi:DNA-binding transcriptional ArsR family regulator
MDEVLKNPHRRKILEILSSKKVATPKEIADELKIGVTTVYYHLELMKGYVAKTARGEYSITDKGIEVYRKSFQEEVSSKTSLGRFMPYNLLVFQISRPLLFLPIGLVVLALEAYVCYTHFFRPFLLGYSVSIDTALLPLFIALNVVILFGVLEGLSYFLTRRLGGELPLLNGILLSRIPLMLTLLVPILGIGDPYVNTIAMALGQLACVVLLSMYLSLAKGMRQEISMVMCIALLYFNLLAYVF